MTDDAGTYSDAIGSLIDQTKRLAKAEAEVTRLRALYADARAAIVNMDRLLTEANAVLDRVEALADSLEAERPSSSAWRGAYRNNARRLHAAMAAPQPTTPDLADTRARADREASA